MIIRKLAAVLLAGYLLSNLPAANGQEPGSNQAQPPPPVKELGERAGERLMAAAWEQYRTGDYEKAAEFFLLAAQSRDRPLADEARLGLGYTWQQLGRIDQAEKLFRELWERQFAPDKSGPALMGILMSQGRFDEAESLLLRLPPPAQNKWAEQLAEARSREKDQEAARQLQQGWQALEAKELVKAVELFQATRGQVNGEMKQDAELGLAYAYWGLDQVDQARGLFEHLVQKDYKINQTRPDLIRILLTRDQVDQARLQISRLPLNQQEQFAHELAAADRRLREREIGRLYQELSQAAAPTRKKELAQAILKLRPGDPGALSALGWACRDLQDYICARQAFERLYQSNSSLDNLLGLVYTLADLGQREAAVQLLASHTGALNPKALELLVRLHKELAQELFNNQEFAAAEGRLRKALEIRPDDRDLLELLGWSLYNQGKSEEALRIFRLLFEKEPSVERAKPVLAVLDREGRPEETWAFIRLLSTDQNYPQLRRLAAQRYYDDGRPISAAQTLSSPGDCYFNYHRPWFTAAPYYQAKQGDAGTSRLNQALLPLTLNRPVPGGGLFRLGLAARELDTGSGPPRPYAGSYYRFLESPINHRHDLITKRTVWQPGLEYIQEGFIRYRAGLGSTPLNGPIDARPTFHLQADRPGDWKVILRQCAVEDSLPAFIGQRDPYSGREWGRVLKTGLEAGKSFALNDSYWISITGGYDYYWGENVAENHGFRGTLSLGRSESLADSDLDLGLFFTAEHFVNNQDHYTYGHGGYFSPEIFLMAGPFVNWRRRSCANTTLGIEASIGYMHYRAAEAPHYRESGTPPALVSLAAQEDYAGVYPAREEDGIGLRLVLDGATLITPYLALGGRASLNTSGNHTQWQAGLQLQFFFHPRSTPYAGQVAGDALFLGQ